MFHHCISPLSRPIALEYFQLVQVVAMGTRIFFQTRIAAEFIIHDFIENNIGNSNIHHPNSQLLW